MCTPFNLKNGCNLVTILGKIPLSYGVGGGHVTLLQFLNPTTLFIIWT